jgi:hypothetical protein
MMQANDAHSMIDHTDQRAADRTRLARQIAKLLAREWLRNLAPTASQSALGLQPEQSADQEKSASLEP